MSTTGSEWTARGLIRHSGLPRHEAERLLIKVTGWRRNDVWSDRDVATEHVEAFNELAEARRTGMPLQHLEGTVAFGPLELLIDDRALVPRPETEQLWEVATSLVCHPRQIADLCTGSGNLALACKLQFPDATVYATDTSPAALDLARENMAYTGLEIDVRQGDLFDALPPERKNAFDLIVANPPYLAAHEHEALAPDVRDHDPHEALVAGVAGTEVIKRIAAAVSDWLAPCGVVVCEISEFHPERTLDQFSGMYCWLQRDHAGKPRFVVAVRNDIFATAGRALGAGGLVGVPTDTVYGIAASAERPGAIDRLSAIKGRAPDKPIALLVDSIEQALAFIHLTDAGFELAERHWPGPLTIVAPAREGAPPHLGDIQQRTIGVRLPPDGPVRRLISAAGPLAVTSANVAGQNPASSPAGACAVFGEEVDMYLPGPHGGGLSSTVVDITSGEPRIVREGPIDLTDL